MNLIPKPAHIEVTGGYFKVDSNLVFGNDQSGTIRYVVDESFNGGNPEGYALDVTEKGIELRAASKSGLFYGEQTLRQLYTSKGIPCVSIQDNPRFPYRGLHLDVSRHFFPKEEVMKLLNVMSYYKLNTLHMHLTDAGGWRIQTAKQIHGSGFARATHAGDRHQPLQRHAGGDALQVVQLCVVYGEPAQCFCFRSCFRWYLFGFRWF